MDRYGAGVTRAGINTADTAYFNLDQTGTAHRLEIVRIVVDIGVAPTTAPAWYLARTSGRGTQASTLVGQAYDPAHGIASLGTLDVTGTGASQPTFTAANKVDVGGLAVTAGGVFVWSFYDKPLIVTNAAGNGIAVCNANASGATTGTFYASYVWDE